MIIYITVTFDRVAGIGIIVHLGRAIVMCITVDYGRVASMYIPVAGSNI